MCAGTKQTVAEKIEKLEKEAAEMLEEFKKFAGAHPDMTFSDLQAPCHGCGHSVSGAVFPNRPSGEWACVFCVRNEDNDFNRPDIRFANAPRRPKESQDYYIATGAIELYREFAEKRAEEKWQPIKELADSLLKKKESE